MKLKIQMDKSICFCGKEGFSNMNMLQCTKCTHWFHEACVKCLAVPMVYGDRFFIFICSACNIGSEYLARIEMKWADVIHLTLYNLSFAHNKKYFDLDESIMPYISQNWARLQLIGPIADERRKNKRDKVLAALERCKKRFKSGKEVKKARNLWGLREMLPPKTPKITFREILPPETPKVVPAVVHINHNAVVWEFNMNGRQYRLLNKKVRSKVASRINRNKVKLKLPDNNAAARPKNADVSKCNGAVIDSENGIQKTAKQKIKRTQSTFLNEDSARYGLLDSMIPAPSDFQYCNNPFRKSGISRQCSKQKIHLDFTTRIAEKPNKRRRFGENPNYENENGKQYPLIQNGDLPHKRNVNGCKNEPLLPKKPFLIHNLQIAKSDNFCIMGKRVTASGITQYLLEWNR